MHSIWKGSISFGLVNIPVALYSGIRRDEDIHFHLLRKSDQSRVRNKRIAEADDEDVAWGDIVKGYEYEKGKYVILTEEELDDIGLKSTRLIDIVAFVDLDSINPVYFSTPYLVQAENHGEKPYQLLLEVLKSTRTAAIAKVILRGGREHLVALMERDQRLVADVLHFEQELQPVTVIPAPHVKIQERERDIARKLVESMKSEWKPEQYKDEYEGALKKLIATKLSGKKITAPKITKSKQPDNVIDLVSILQQSLKQKSPAEKTRTKKSPPAAKQSHQVKRRKAA